MSNTTKSRPWGVHTISSIYSAGCDAGLPDGRWVAAVAEPYTANRLVAAWWVLTGRAFAFLWPKAGDLEDALGVKGRSRSLLRPASAAPPLPTDPAERARVTRENADYYRNTLKPFA
jgi:hypothetical protein